MKILYLGMVCNKANYLKEIEKSKVKPSVAALVFENALLKGFKENNVDLTVKSFPVFPSFPHSKKLFWTNKIEELESGYKTEWIPAININAIKQLTLKMNSKRMIKQWIKDNKDEDKVVLVYSIFEPIGKSVIDICKKTNTKCFAIVPDLPRDMFKADDKSFLRSYFKKMYVRKTTSIQSLFDGYVYLTEKMKDVISTTKPYIVIEGIADLYDNNKNLVKANNKNFVIMYAGGINKSFGIDNLVKAFIQLKNEDIELRLFGYGDYVSELELYCQKDRRIKYYGWKTREEILKYEAQADLLVNLRNNMDEYTKYSFPSKTIEYMLSGTPLLITALEGIPDEYYNYVYSIPDNDIQTIQNKLCEMINLDKRELEEMAKNAYEFIKNNKNAQNQAKKIYFFLKENIKDGR